MERGKRLSSSCPAPVEPAAPDPRARAADCDRGGRAVGVEFEVDGSKFTARCRGEIVLSSGLGRIAGDPGAVRHRQRRATERSWDRDRPAPARRRREPPGPSPDPVRLQGRGRRYAEHPSRLPLGARQDRPAVRAKPLRTDVHGTQPARHLCKVRCALRDTQSRISCPTAEPRGLRRRPRPVPGLYGERRQYSPRQPRHCAYPLCRPGRSASHSPEFSLDGERSNGGDRVLFA